jgi:D-alanyl-lipoteichoic acid acyltransferase DltB (MBOAT superfamily)
VKFTDGFFLPFLTMVLVGWLLLRRRYWLTVWGLLGASFYFYSYRGEVRVPLLLAYCLVDWFVGRRLPRSRHPRWWLALGVGFNLAVLAFFKHGPMLTHSAVDLVNLLGGKLQVPAHWFVEWSIPFGLSFYAFTGIAYLVDVHRNRAEVEPSFARFSLYISFFPQLMAGPILRPRDFLGQLQPGALPTRCEHRFEAVYLCGRGLFKKLVLADRIGLAIDPYFSHVADPSTAGVWALPYLYLYALQIFFDFSGYTDLARGLGLLFGFRWPRNFDLPYLALSIRDFWRRWHMTLSRFLRDYLYISLGGNRHGTFRTSVNLMVTMLLGGIWHGASWSFMVWGGLHGLYLLLHRLWEGTALARRLGEAHGVVRWLQVGLSWFLTFHAVVLAWAFFRITHWAVSLLCVAACFRFDPARMLGGAATDPSLLAPIFAYGVWALVEHRLKPRITTAAGEYEIGRLPPLLHGAAWGGAILLLLLGVILKPGGEAPPFIYFQF